MQLHTADAVRETGLINENVCFLDWELIYYRAYNSAFI